MTAAELIAALQRLDPETEIVIVDADTGWLMHPHLEEQDTYQTGQSKLSAQGRFGLYGSYGDLIVDES